MKQTEFETKLRELKQKDMNTIQGLNLRINDLKEQEASLGRRAHELIAEKKKNRTAAEDVGLDEVRVGEAQERGGAEVHQGELDGGAKTFGGVRLVFGERVAGKRVQRYRVA